MLQEGQLYHLTESTGTVSEGTPSDYKWQRQVQNQTSQQLTPK